MAETINRGPTANLGATEDARTEPMDGPSLEYQGIVAIDPRFSPIAKDGTAPARVKGYFQSPQYVVVDAIPSATSTTTVAAAQNPTTTVGTVIALTTAVL